MEGFVISFVVLVVVANVDLIVEAELSVTKVIGTVPISNSSSSAVDEAVVALKVELLPKFSSVVIGRLDNLMIFGINTTWLFIPRVGQLGPQ